MRDWPGRPHVETLRVWPELSRVADRIEGEPTFAGAVLIGSLSRGEGDELSDVDLIAVTHANGWQAGWSRRTALSSGALVTFDRFEEGRAGVAGHFWLTSSLVKVECLIAEPGAVRIAGSAVVIVGSDELLDDFEAIRAFTRQEIRDYAEATRETRPEIEQAYDDFIALLRRAALPRTG
jgi:hypothetical protein